MKTLAKHFGLVVRP